MANVTDPRLIAALNAASAMGGAAGLPPGVPMPPGDDGAGYGASPFTAIADGQGGSSYPTGSGGAAQAGGPGPSDPAQSFDDLRLGMYRQMVDVQGIAPGRAMVMADRAARQSFMGGQDGQGTDQGDDASGNSPGPFPRVGSGLASAPLLGDDGSGAGGQGAGGVGGPFDAQGFSALRRNIYQSLVNDQGVAPGQAMVLAHEAARQGIMDGPVGSAVALDPIEEFQAAAGATGAPIAASGAPANPNLDGGIFGYTDGGPSAPNDGSRADDGSLPGNFDPPSGANSPGPGAGASSASPAVVGDMPTSGSSGAYPFGPGSVTPAGIGSAATDFTSAGQPIPGASTAFAAGWSPPGRGRVGSDASTPPVAPPQTGPAPIGSSAAGHGPRGFTPEIIDAARSTQKKFGVPASITLAQYAQESRRGAHMPHGSNNPFGIKAHGHQPFVLAPTREQDKHGRWHHVLGKFRTFPSVADAFEAHAKLLTGRRFAAARSRLPNVDAYANALTGVYATDHNYGRRLRSIIHHNNLTQYDR